MKKLIYLLLVTFLFALFSLNVSAQDGGKELFEAVKTKNKERALELIKQGVDLNYDINGDTTLTEAIRQRDTEMAKTLLAAGANPNQIDVERGGSALRMAVQMSNLELVSLMLDKYKPDVNPKSGTGYSILHTAGDFNQTTDITALLLAAGSDPNVINSAGLAPYEYALANNKADIAKLLATVTNMDKIAALKKLKGVPMEMAKPTPIPTASDDEEEMEEEMENIASDLTIAFKKQGFVLYEEGFTNAVGRNSNESGVKSKSVFGNTGYVFVMISKNAVGLNAIMNGTLLQVPCSDCRTSISSYATELLTDNVNGYRIVRLNFALKDSQNNFIDLIFKSNKGGERVKWIYYRKR